LIDAATAESIHLARRFPQSAQRQARASPGNVEGHSQSRIAVPVHEYVCLKVISQDVTPKRMTNFGTSVNQPST
jgi:hypothetical protein